MFEYIKKSYKVGIERLTLLLFYILAACAAHAGEKEDIIKQRILAKQSNESRKELIKEYLFGDYDVNGEEYVQYGLILASIYTGEEKYNEGELIIDSIYSHIKGQSISNERRNELLTYDGLVKYSLKDYLKAIPLLEKADSLNIAQQNRDYLCCLFLYLSYLNSNDREKYDKALELNDYCIKTSASENDTASFLVNIMNRGTIYIAMDSVPQAIQMFENVENLRKTWELPQDNVNIANIALYLSRVGRYIESEKEYLRVDASSLLNYYKGSYYELGIVNACRLNDIGKAKERLSFLMSGLNLIFFLLYQLIQEKKESLYGQRCPNNHFVLMG